MNTIIKTFSTIGALSILAAGMYINSDTNENTTDNNSQQSIVIENEHKPVQMPFVDEIETDTELVNDLQGVKVIPKPEPVKPPVQKPVVKPEPVKEKPAVEAKEQPVEEVKKEPVKPEPVVETKPEKPKTDNVKAIDRAKDTTKGYCAPELWVKWKPDSKEEGEYIGLAYRSILYWEDKSQPDIQTITVMISPEIDGKIDQTIHTAWHECAHAKTYSISPDKIDETIKEIKKAFPETKHSRMETLADAMATVKIGNDEYNYYHSGFTKEQLKVAEKVWNLSPEITTEMEYDYDAWEKLSELY